jgi:hypothetical protein
MTTTLRSAPTSPLLTPEQTADLLDTTAAELDAQRAAGIGPTYHSMWPGAVRYDTASVIQWKNGRPMARS